MARQSHTQTEPRSVGRPRRLTLDTLLDAANEMGLHQVNMKALSARLGVGIATLYRYVENRDELVRLAATRQALRRPPPDTGQPWQDILIGYAEALYSVLGHNPQMIVSYLEGGLGVELEAESLDSFLAAMIARDFTPVDALNLYRVMGQIVMGTAAAAAHVAAVNAAGRNMDRSLRQALALRDVDDLQSLRGVADAYVNEEQLSDWRIGLGHVIRSVALQRGETDRLQQG